jgi:type IV fimbrial biogenesis protein FimT
VLNPARSQRGVSLVEVMIGLTLAGILIAMGIPSFQAGLQNRQIRSTAEAIQSGLHLARTEALRRNRPVRFEMQGGNGWRIGCDPEDTTLVDGQPACPQVLQTRDGAEGGRNAEVARVAVGATSGTDSGGFEELRFNSLGRIKFVGVSDADAAANRYVYRITNPKGGSCFADGGEMRCLSIVVTSAGQIRMCDPGVSAPDSRAC